MLLWVRCSGAAVSHVGEQSAMQLHVAVKHVTEQTRTGSIKTINWSERLYHSQSSCFLMWIRKIVDHLDV